MKKNLFLLIIFFISGWVVCAQDGIRKGVIQVKLKPAMAKKISALENDQGTFRSASVNKPLAIGVSSFDAVTASYQATEMRRIIPYSPKYNKKHQKYGLDLWYEIKISDAKDPEAAVRSFLADANVENATIVHEKVLYNTPSMTSIKSMVNDPYLNLQWNFSNTGQYGGTSGIDINLQEAWEVTKGNPNVIVAVLDGGVDYRHTDLKDNMWVNKAELNGHPGMDNDGNGYVGDVYGYNFYDNSPDITPTFHGTHVAGTISAVNNNGIGVAGVAGGDGYGTGVRIMSCQIYDNSGQAGGDAAAALIYAADNGAVIAQNSWGYAEPGIKNDLVYDAIKYFIAEAGKDENGKPLPDTPMVGGIVFFAVGNDDSPLNFYPASYEEVIAVGAITDTGEKASYSNYGAWVDIVAPGGNGMDTGKDERGIISTIPDNKYGYTEGTSMACPHVSGVAALVLSKFGSNTYTPNELKKRILNTARELPGSQYYAGGTLGVGLVDAGRALRSGTEAPEKITDLQVNQTSISAYGASFTWTKPSGNIHTYEIACSAQNITEGNFDNYITSEKRAGSGSADNVRIGDLKPNTTYYVALRVMDPWANKSSISNVVSFTTKNNPVVGVSTNELIADVDVNVSPSKTMSFTITNSGSAALDYELSYSRGNIFKDAETFSDSLYMDKPGQEGDSQAQAIGNSSLLDPVYAATKFTVTQESFTLTHVKVYFRNFTTLMLPSEDPIIIKIYKGENPPVDNMELCTAETKDGDSYLKFHTVVLDEMLEFKKGETFWIVVRYPEGLLQPVGVSPFMSNMSGRNLFKLSENAEWADLNEGVREGQQSAFRIRALSALEGNPPATLSLSRTTGSISSNSSENINVSFDGSKMVNGTYSHTILVSHTDSLSSVLSISAPLRITGHKAAVNAAESLDWGITMIGEEKIMPLTIRNEGLGALNISGFNINNTTYSVMPDYPTIIEANSSGRIYIKFSPKDNTLQTGTLTINSDIDPIQVSLSGQGQQPPVIRLSDYVINETMAEGQSKSVSIDIYNDGAYDLEYYVSGLPEFLEPSSESGSDLSAGYTWVTSRHTAGPNPGWIDISSTGLEITKEVDARTTSLSTFDLGFAFPYYGEYYSLVTVGKGMVIVENEQVPNYKLRATDRILPRNSSDQATLIAAFWTGNDDRDFMSFTRVGGKVYVQELPGKYVIQFNGVALPYRRTKVYPSDTHYLPPVEGSFDCQIILHTSGVIEFNYRGLDEKTKGEITAYGVVGIQDKTETDGFTISPYEAFLENDEELTILISPPNSSVVSSVKPMKGTVAPGRSSLLNISLDADNILEKNLNPVLLISSNDPQGDAELKISVQPSNYDGKVTLSSTSVDLGTVYVGQEKISWLYLNNGTPDTLIITNIDWDLKRSSFKYDLNDNIVPPGGRASIAVSYTADAVGSGVDMEMLRIEHSLSSAFSLVQVNVTEIKESPVITVNTAPVNVTLDKGDTFNGNFEIENIGVVEANVNIAATNWIKIGNRNSVYSHASEGYTDGGGYLWEDNTNSKNVTYQWIEPDKADMLEENMPFSKSLTLTLPFDFEFYGNKYRTFFTRGQGVIGFGSESNTQYWQASTPIPNPNVPNNFIAVMRMDLCGFSDFGPPEAEVPYYFYYTRKADQVILTWENFPCRYQSTKGTVTFQAILYKDGRIKMQYKDVETALWRNQATIGIENADGTKGLEIDLGTSYYTNDNLAILITPGVEEETIAVGSKKDIAFTVTTEGLSNGAYQGSIYVQSEGLNNGINVIPVTLTVNPGEPIWNADEADFGDITCYNNEDGWYTYTREIYVRNVSSDIITLTGASLLNSTENVSIEVSREYPFEIAIEDSVLFKVNYMPTSALGVVEDRIIFTTTNPALNILAYTDFKANVDLPSVATFFNEDLKVTLMENTTGKRTLQVKNDGEGVLKYNISVEPLRINPLSTGEPVIVGENSVTDAEEYLSGLIFEDITRNSPKIISNRDSYLETLSHALKSGSGEIYTNKISIKGDVAISTCLRAGEAGFNLTDIIAAYFPGTVQKQNTFDVEIRVASAVSQYYTVERATTIYRETFELAEPSADYVEHVISLATPQYIYPEEYVYIILHFNWDISAGQGIPVGTLDVYDLSYTEDICMKFAVSLGGNYYQDFCITNYAGYGTGVVACSSEYAKQGTGNWLEVLEPVGTIAPGESKAIELSYDASKATGRINQMIVNVNNNDPTMDNYYRVAQLNINSAPVITLPDSHHIGMEPGGFLNYEFRVEDPDGDDFDLLVEGVDFGSGTIAHMMNHYYSLSLYDNTNEENTYTIRFKATDSNNLVAYSEDITVEVREGYGIADKEIDSAIRIYPQDVEAGGKITVVLEDISKSQLQLFNIQGTLLMEKELTSLKEEITAPLVSGLYVIRISAAGLQKEFKLIVK